MSIRTLKKLVSPAMESLEGRLLLSTYQLIGDNYLNVGNEWDYATSGTSVGTMVNQVIGTTSVAGVTCSDLESTITAGGHTLAPAESYQVLSADNVVTYGGSVSGGVMTMTEINNNPMELMPRSVSTTDNHRVFGDGEFTVTASGQASWTMTQQRDVTYLGLQNLTLPINGVSTTFTGCVKILIVHTENNSQQADNTLRQEITEVVYPGVGVLVGQIKSYTNNMLQGTTTSTLTSYKPKTLVSSAVTVSVVSNSLKITGDAGDDHISIAQTDAGAYTITGLDGTQVRLGASVSGSQQVTGATKDISIDMGVGAVKGNAGNDTVELAGNLQAGNGVTLGSIIYKGGSGNDRVFLGGVSARATVTFNANPLKGDTVQMTDPMSIAKTFEFVNDLTDTLSDPSNLPVLIGAAASDTMVNFLGAVNEHAGLVPADASVGGASCQLMALPGSAGNHETIVVSTTNITASSFTGGADYMLNVKNVTVTLGDGGNLLGLGTLSTTTDNFPSTILGNLSVTGGKNHDVVAATNVYTYGNLAANLGAGDNNLTLDTAGSPTAGRQGRVGGNLNYTGLGGADNIVLANSEVDGTLTANVGLAGANSNGLDAGEALLKGAVTYTAGATGNNDLDFSWASLGKTLAVTTGGGDDTVQLDSAQVTGNVTMTLGGGDNSFLSLGPTIVTFGGNVSFTTTAKGDNQFVIVGGGGAANNIAGALTVTTGAGDDTVNITTNVGGNLSINTGTSPDGDMIDCSDGVVTGTATIKSGNAGNVYGEFQIWGMTFKHAATLGTGTGISGVDIEGCDFGSLGGAFNLTSGAGADTVKIAASTGFAPTTFRGAVNVSLGAGNDTLQIGASSDTADGGTGDANTHASFLGSVSRPIFNGGAGTSTMNYLNEGGNIALPIANVFTLTPAIAKFSKS